MNASGAALGSAPASRPPPPRPASPAEPPSRSSSPRRHLLTVGLEDYYDVSVFSPLIERTTWSRFERRLEVGTRRALALLAEHHARATFFVLGWVADTFPELVREVAEQGHEVASRGYHHRPIAAFTPASLREDLERTREALTRATGRPVHGHRIPDWLDTTDFWALDVIADAGFAYDSSLRPLFRRLAAEPWRRFAHRHRHGDRELWEFPLSALEFTGWCLPVAGGNYFRQLPQALVTRAVAHWDRTTDAPFVMYFHTWELDPAQPKITAAPLTAQARHYRNLDRMADILRPYLARYAFTSVAEHLGLALHSRPHPLPSPVPARARPITVTTPRRAARPAITIVVPCFDEERALPLLFTALEQVEARLARDYEVRLLFVDDASRDDTATLLERACARRPNARLVRHAVNRGVAASIRTGIQHADTEIVCSMDCDCTYDPLELAEMLPLLADDVTLVTGSPYHREGRVRNVPQWRLGLSRSLSGLYRLVLGQPLRTYTSCFRVYRRSRVLPIPLEHGGYLGVAELLGKVLLAGGRVVEHPTTLSVRVLGHSKLRTMRTIVGHLALLARLARLRLVPPGRRHALLLRPTAAAHPSPSAH